MGMTITGKDATSQGPILKLHLAPLSPIELGQLTSALTALARQYSSFVDNNGVLGRGSDAKLLVSSVSPGSIDIGLLPDWSSLTGLLASAYEPLTHLTEFASKIKDLIDLFKTAKKKDEAPDITIRDCNDAINIASPIANHDGTQTVFIVHNKIESPIFILNVSDAQNVVQNASSLRELLASPEADVRQRVPLTWTQLNKDKSRTSGSKSQDRGIIEEIDSKDKPIFFTDEMLFLKDRMVGDDDNPYVKVYFVDVEISKALGKAVSYRITAFHGKDEL